MSGYVIAIAFSILCWIATYIFTFLAIRKNFYSACFYTWYFGKNYDKMPKDKIKEITYIEQNGIINWIWGCWVMSSLWAGLTIILIYNM
jgi:hypothetical protein